MKLGRPLSDMTLMNILRSIGLADRATVHGFRTSFKTWCKEQTDTPWAVGAAGLAHNLGNSTEQAYAWSDLFERRRELMQQWADYVTGEDHHASGQDINAEAVKIAADEAIPARYWRLTVSLP